MQQTATPGSVGTLTNACGTRRRRVVRILIGAALIGMALSWFLVTDLRVWRGPFYGVWVESRGDLAFEWVYRSDKQSVECSVWRFRNEGGGIIAAPLFQISTGKDNHVVFGDDGLW